MNILQFESLNLEYICKRYEINKFWNIKLGLILRLTKRLGFSANSQGPARETEGRWVDF
jgi:hypothetical protein